MIYLILTLVGVILIVVGLYSMSFGFTTPPSFLLFFAGLVSFVIGFMLIILFGSMIDIDALRPAKSEAKTTPSRDRTRMRRRPKIIKESVETKKAEPKPIKPVRKEAKKVEPKPIKPVKKVKPKPVKPVKREPKKVEPVKAEEKKPERKLRKFIRKTPPAKKDETIVSKGKGVSDKPETTKKAEQKEAEKTAEFKQKLNQISKPSKKEEKEAMVKDKEESVEKPPEKKDEEYPKNRLNKLKKDYMENIDVDELLDERLETFKGVLNHIRSQSKSPNIIWSFDADDVQDTMKDLIISAEKKVNLMYPWIRNIDVAVLKKFMDTQSRVIIQEASLDDDAAVELIKVLLDNKVQIKTMPHIHTVTAVSDDKNGLIISTDPIYESFEVGVIYKDQESISEIENLFEEAWGLSNDIDLEVSM